MEEVFSEAAPVPGRFRLNVTGVSEGIRSALDELVREYDHRHLDSDPVGLVRALTQRADREIGGLMAAALSLGRVTTIRAKITELFDRLDGRPAEAILRERRTIRKRLRGFRHRFFGEDDLLRLAERIMKTTDEHGSLGAGWRRDLPFAEAASVFAASLSGKRSASLPLVPSPADGSPSKRLMMYLRWMVRPDDGIDLGLWKNPRPSELIIPMDVHVFRISRMLDFTARSTPSWKAACEVTEALRRFDARDPTRYDFALAHLGIVAGCTGRQSPACDECGIRRFCARR